jgi:hypothetical protein
MNDETLLGLIAPRGDEELVGAVLTTFVLDGRFAEEELLTTLAGLAVGSGELGRASSELHERLLATEAGVTVFVDSRGFDGTRRVAVYDLQQVAAPPTFHPKVALMIWQEPTRKPSVRALVTSANLTREGYRRNAELAVVADSGDPADHRLLADLVTYLRGIAHGYPLAIDLLDRAARELSPRNEGSRRLLVSRGRPLLDLFFDQLAPDEVIESAVVVSPFFERSTDPAGASTIEAWCRWLLAHSGNGKVRARFFVPERFVDGQLVLELPISRAVGLLGAQAELWTLDSLWPIEGRAEPVPRPLHGKLLAVETDRRCFALAGSANFTNAALLVGGAAANWEASVLLSLRRGALERLLPTAATRRDPSAVVFQPPEAEPPLPELLFDRATYEAARRRLRVQPRRGARADRTWELRVDGERVADGPTGALHVVTCSLQRHPVNFAVEQRTAAGSRHIPIEVSDKENLPLPAAGVQPRGEDVLDYFAGLRTPAEFDATSRGDGTGTAERDELPALEHLSRFSRALYGIQDSLDRPARSILEYRARWTGAWGLQRVIELLEHRIDSSDDDPSYSLFEACELEATLVGLALVEDERCPAAVKRELRDAAISELGRLRRKLERMVGDAESVSLIRRAYGHSAG